MKMSQLGILLLLLAFNNSKKVQTGFGFYINSDGKTQSIISLIFSRHSELNDEEKILIQNYLINNDIEKLKNWKELNKLEKEKLEKKGINEKLWNLILEMKEEQEKNKNQELWDNYEYDSENNKFYKSRKKLSPEEFYETLTDKEKETLNGLIHDLDKNIKNLDDDRLSIYVTLLNMLKGTKYNSAQILKRFGNLTVEEFIKKFKLAPSINGLYWKNLSNNAKLYLSSLGYTQYLWDNIDL